MKIILFGASGMLGQAVLRECLLDPDVQSVLAIGRRPLAQKHDKLRELVQANLYDLSSAQDPLKGYEACFFCLGVSSFGMSEADYAHVTYDLTMAVAQTLVALNPGMTFIYVSGLGTDSTEKGRSMWARVKGKTENALLRLPFKAAYMFRPGAIQPLHGIQSKTLLYRLPYMLLSPVIPLFIRWLPRYITTTERLGRAMLQVAKHGAPHPILEGDDINRLGNV